MTLLFWIYESVGKSVFLILNFSHFVFGFVSFTLSLTHLEIFPLWFVWLYWHDFEIAERPKIRLHSSWGFSESYVLSLKSCDLHFFAKWLGLLQFLHVFPIARQNFKYTDSIARLYLFFVLRITGFCLSIRGCGSTAFLFFGVFPLERLFSITSNRISYWN